MAVRGEVERSGRLRHGPHASGGQGTTSGELYAVAQNDFERDKRRAGWIAVETGAFVLATSVIAIFTDWTPHGDDDEGEESTQASVDVSPTGATLRLRRDF